MKGDDFRQLALKLAGAAEQSHMGHPDFRVGGKIFASLGPDEDWAMVKLTPDEQASFIAAQPTVFGPASGAWGRRGCTIVQLKSAKKSLVTEALQMAWSSLAPPTRSGDKKQPSAKNPVEAVRQIAMSFPETTTSVVCDKTSFKARNKAFVFLGDRADGYTVMVKLRDSLAEAQQLAAAEPERYCVGGHDWVTLTFPHGQRPPRGLLERWIAESHRLLAPKRK